MNHIDSILPHLSQHIKLIEPLIPKKDKRILVSLAKQVNGGTFLTENQAKLMVKIFKENLPAMRTLFQDIEETISENSWSKKFRVVQKIRKIYINPDNPNYFSVEFSFNTRLREKIAKIFPDTWGLHSSKGSSRHSFLLTEHNVDIVISNFLKDDFDIEQSLLDFYREITGVKSAAENPFKIFSTTHERLKSSVIKDVGIIESANLMKLQDRKIRFQYSVDDVLSSTSLAAKIANRTSRMTYLSPKTASFVELVSSLKELERLPLLIIFDGANSEKDKATLKLIEHAVTTLDLGTDIGVYFRYDKPDDAANFNQEISTLKYNKNLSNSTTIAGISNTKFPKFMLELGWKPRAVISFTNSFRANRASVYCTDVDLIIYYTAEQPFSNMLYKRPTVGQTIHELL